MQKFLFSILIYLSITVCVHSQVKIEKPTLNTNNKAFVIVVDQETYTHTQDAIKAYQKTVESDGIPTYVIYGLFNRPDDIKKELIKLHKSKQSLEGAVFIGNIPIPMVYDFSGHVTATPSDRFYDDLHLNFEYIKQDANQRNLHYYKLQESSPRDINPSFYSARIYYPTLKYDESYEAINNYLLKVAHTRRDNVLDHVVSSTNRDYYNGCTTAWKDELKVYREYFPFLVKQVNGLQQLAFKTDNSTAILNELQRKEVDLFLIRSDSSSTIQTTATKKLDTYPLYLILDTQPAGALDSIEYTAGQYLFNSGNTIAVQANTSPAPTDINFSGLLSYGLRWGHVHNLGLTLGRHLFGDPTFHFAVKDTEKLNEKITQQEDHEYWKLLLKKDDPIYQTLALFKLSSGNTSSSEAIMPYFENSPYRTVRLQALHALSIHKDKHFTNAVSTGLGDEYELIAQQATSYARMIGDTVLIPSLTQAWLNDKSRRRVQQHIKSTFEVFDRNLVEKSLTTALHNSNRLHQDTEIESVKSQYSRPATLEGSLKQIKDRTRPKEERIRLVQLMTTYNYHPGIDGILAIINDKQEPIELRIAFVTALGTFSHSWKRETILANLQILLKSKAKKELKIEAERTINRLN